MKKIYLAYLLLIILSACGSKNTNSVYLNGEIKGLGNDTLYIYGTDKFYNRMDTLLVKDDKFSATLTTDTLASTWLQFSDGTEYPLYLDKGDNIKIKGSAAELTSLEITGNVPNEELTAFQKELKGLSTPSEKALEEKAEAFINSHPSSWIRSSSSSTYGRSFRPPVMCSVISLIKEKSGCGFCTKYFSSR